jgi:hypothetical protein
LNNPATPRRGWIMMTTRRRQRLKI